MTLQLGVSLQRPRLFFRPSTDDIMSMSTFELMIAMRADGWSQAVRPKGRKGTVGTDAAKQEQSNADAPPQFADYVTGGVKVFWSKMSDESITPQYLQALLRAPQHGKAVKHFMQVGYYDAILNNRDHVPKRRRPFDFSADAGVVHVPKKRPRVARPARPPKRSLFDVDDDADQPEPDVVVDGDGDGGDESDGDVDGDNDGDSDSSSAPSSSSSSSTSSTASTASAEPEPPSEQPAPVPAAVPAAAVAENPGLDSVAKSTSWKGFKFTSKKNDSGVVVGWEATCYNNDHKLPGNHCRRTRNFVPGEI